MRMFRKILKIAGGVILVLILVVMIAKLWADSTYFNDYDPALPFNVRVEGSEVVDGTVDFFGITRDQQYEKVLFTIDARRDEPIPVLMTMPVQRSGKLPVIIFLHGIGQSKSFLERICTPFNQAGFAMVCFDQHMQGERRIRGNPLKTIKAFRQRPWKTINDGRRLIDYLETHPEIDAERVYLIGASYGAITGTTLTAREERIGASVLVVGGGHLKTMLNAPMIRDGIGIAPLHWLASTFVTWLMRPADPVHYAHLTAGTPVLMQSGSEDILVTPEAGEALYQALGEPKEIRWYPCDHPGLRDEDAPIIVQILDEGLAWLLEIDAQFRTDEELPALQAPEDVSVEEDMEEAA